MIAFANFMRICGATFLIVAMLESILMWVTVLIGKAPLDYQPLRTNAMITGAHALVALACYVGYYVMAHMGG